MKDLKINFVQIITLGVFLLTSSGCSNNESDSTDVFSSHPRIPDGWKVVHLESHKCQIAFPIPPQNTSKRYKKIPYPTTSFDCKFENYYYSLSAQDYSKDPETADAKLLLANSTNRKNNPAGTVLNIEPIQWNGYEGVEVQYQRSESKFIVLRDLVVEDQTYLILIGGPGPLDELQLKADEFFNSFGLLGSR